jgi:hypothetical protein
VRPASGSGLADRLRPHVRGRVADGGRPWWGPPAGRLDVRADVVAHLAVLVAAGRPLREAIAEVGVDGSSGAAVAAARIAAGATPTDAVRAWARASGCGDVGVLALDLQRAVSTDDVEAAVAVAAARLRRRADDELGVRAVRRARVVSAAGFAAAAAAAALVLP